MQSNWRKAKLGDYVDILTGFPFQSKYFSGSKGIRLVRGDNISSGFLDWSKTKYWPNYEDSLKKFLLKESDVLIGMDGSKVGQNKAVVRKEDLPLLLVQRVASLRAKEGLLQDYLYFVIFSKQFTRYVDSIKTGSAVPHISAEQIADYEFYLPPIEEQERISRILAKLTEKIQLISNINKTLEAIAQAIFKNWFVDFEPFKDGDFEYNETLNKEIPKDWKVGTVADLCKRITNGGTPRRMEPRFWKNGNIPWFKTGELMNSVLMDSEEKITQQGLENSSCHLLPINTVAVALYASPTVGRLGLLKVPATTNQACTALEAKDEIGYGYVFHVLLSNQQYLNIIAVGSVQQNISREIVKNLTTPIPPMAIAKKFQQLVEPLYDQMTNNEVEKHILVAIRDSLIPRLLSGEIRGKVDVEKEFPEETKKLEEIKDEKSKIQKSISEWVKHA